MRRHGFLVIVSDLLLSARVRGRMGGVLGDVDMDGVEEEKTRKVVVVCRSRAAGDMMRLVSVVD